MEMGSRWFDKWNSQRARLNHDWLRVKYLTFVQAWKDELNGMGSGKEVSKDIRDQLMEWNSKVREWEEFLDGTEESLTPRQFLEQYPLDGLPEDQKKWLGRVIHELFCARTGIRSKVNELRAQMESVNNHVKQLNEGIAGEDGGGHLYLACLKFSEMVSALPGRVQVP